jgi:hypothetical protein
VVDPDVVPLTNGKLQLAYLAVLGPLNATSMRAICVAESCDAVTFSVRSTAHEAPSTEQLTDPSQ